MFDFLGEEINRGDLLIVVSGSASRKLLVSLGELTPSEKLKARPVHGKNLSFKPSKLLKISREKAEELMEHTIERARRQFPDPDFPEVNRLMRNRYDDFLALHERLSN